MKFSEIIGQQKAKATLHKFVKEDRLPHALILKGPAGTGKLVFANAIAQLINCDNPTENEACGECPNCIKIRKGIHPDVRFVLPIISKKEGGKQLSSDDFFRSFREKFFGNPYFSYEDWVQSLGAENKQLAIFIHDIRELKRKLSLKAFEAKYKVVIFWNMEKIRTEAANALLKLLEEPPERTIILMTVSDPTLLLTTINSRCQRLQMHRIEDSSMMTYLTEKKELSPDHAQQIAQLAEGSISKAIGLINQTNKAIGELYRRWLRVCFKGDYKEIQSCVEQLAKESKEYQKVFLSYAIQKIRDSLLFSFNLEGLAMVTEEEKEFHKNFSRFVSLNGVDKLAKELENSLYYISRNANTQMVLIVLSLKVHSFLRGIVLI